MCPLPHCDKAYCRYVALDSHIRAIHCGDRYKCSLCSREFTRFESLPRHIRENHKHDNPAKITAEQMVQGMDYYKYLKEDKTDDKNERIYRLMDQTKLRVNITHFIQDTMVQHESL